MDNDALLPGAVHAPSDDETATGKAVAAATNLGQGRHRVGDKGGRRRVRLLLTSSIAMVRHIYGGALTQQPHVTYLDVV